MSIREKWEALEAERLAQQKSRHTWRWLAVSVTVYMIVSFFTVWFITR